MHLDFAILADGANPRGDGKFDIYGAGVDTIFAAEVPTEYARLALIVRISASAEEVATNHRLDVALSSVDGAQLANATGNVEALPEEVRAGVPPGGWIGLGLLLTFENLVFPDYGRYQLSLAWDSTPLRRPLGLVVAEFTASQ